MLLFICPGEGAKEATTTSTTVKPATTPTPTTKSTSESSPSTTETKATLTGTNKTIFANMSFSFFFNLINPGFLMLEKNVNLFMKLTF